MKRALLLQPRIPQRLVAAARPLPVSRCLAQSSADLDKLHLHSALPPDIWQEQLENSVVVAELMTEHLGKNDLDPTMQLAECLLLAEGINANPKSLG